MTQDANTELDDQFDTQEVQPEIEASEADSSTDSGENHEEKSNGVQERINQITREKWEERRKREAAEAELEKLRNDSQQSRAESQAAEVTLQPPELPEDIYDEEAMKQYHKDMVSYTQSVSKYQTEQFYKSQQQAQKQTQTQQQQQERIQRYAENAQKAGVDLDKLQNAEKLLIERRIDPQLANRLLTDPNGPQVVTYLADNPSELDSILSADPMTAAVMIETQIKGKALATTPRVTKAPDPIPDIGGGGSLETDDFKRKYGDPEFI